MVAVGFRGRQRAHDDGTPGDESSPARPAGATAELEEDRVPEPKVSEQIERWLSGDRPKTLASLIEMFGDGSFSIAFVLLMALPALPLPTGGATHVLEVITMLLALELIAGHRHVWLPRRWQAVELVGKSSERVIRRLLAAIRRLERFSHPRGQWLLRQRLSGVVFGLAVLLFTLAAFLAPPFSGLDTLPSLGVVGLALGFLLADAVIVAAGLLIGAIGVGTVIALGSLVAGSVGL
jgi:hypothetical protein